MPKKERKIDWEKSKKVVSELKKGKWYEDYDEAEGIFMGWKKYKNNCPVSYNEFLKFYDKHVKGKKVYKKRTKSEIMPADGTAKKITEKDNTKWKTEGDFEGNLVYPTEPNPICPDKPLDNTYVFNYHSSIPTIYSRVIWISRNPESTMVDVWDQKPKMVKTGLRKDESPYFVNPENNGQGSCAWIVPSLSVILFGVAPDEGKLVGPIMVHAELISTKKSGKKNGKKIKKRRN